MVLGRRRQHDGTDGQGHVLVVNDDEGTAELLRRILARAGYVATTAASSASAIEALGVTVPDCVVADLTVGGVAPNLELLETVRNNTNRDVADARFVLAAEESSSVLFAWQAGIDAVLVRPFHADDLVARVAEVLARSDAERAEHRAAQLNG